MTPRPREAASWAPRRDLPELDGHGRNKLSPMRDLPAFAVAAGKDPRGMPVKTADGEIVGTVTDMWVDEPEQLVRYLEYQVDEAFGSGTRLVPMTLARIWFGNVLVRTIFSQHVREVPQLADPNQVTLLEEDKISAYYAGGNLYASAERLEPQI